MKKWIASLAQWKMEGQDMTALDQFNDYLRNEVHQRDREQVRYMFEERAGIAMDSGATKEEGEAIAWDEIRKEL